MAGRIAYYGNIVTSGLVLNLDAAKRDSYPGSGTTWRDISGNGNNGTLTNGPTFNSDNYGSIAFDGVDDYVNCGSGSSLNSIISYTVSLWVKFPNAIRNYNPIFARRNPSTSTSDIEIYTGNGGITIVHNRDNAGTIGYNTLTTISNNTITLITITYSSNTWTTYFNGVLSQQVTTTINLGSSPIPNPVVTVGLYTEIGKFFYGYGEQTIYNYLVYNRALSTQEILQNYNATKTRYGL